MLRIKRTEEAKQAPLKKVKTEAVYRVNCVADEIRRLYITPIAGQELIYMKKEEEAKTFLALETEPEDLSDFPFIGSEIGSTGMSPREVAEVFYGRSQAWKYIGVMIEKLRVNTLSGIKNASSEEEVSQLVEFYEEDMEELR